MSSLLRFLERLNLTTKLILGFCIGLLLALAIGLNALSSLSTLEAVAEDIYAKDLLAISSIKEANINLIYMGRAVRLSSAN